MMNYLVDTNILVQLASRKAVRYALVRAALKQLRRAGNTLRVAPQNLIEFWNVATRPLEKNGDDVILRHVRESAEQYPTDDEFLRAMEYVLEKNKELYQRLA